MTVPDNQPDHDALRKAAEECAMECASILAPFNHYADKQDEAAADFVPVISRHFTPPFEQLRKENELLKEENKTLRAQLREKTQWQCTCGGTDCAGQAENERLRAELDKFKADHTRLQMELDASCNSEELRQRKAEVDRLKTENNSLRTLWTEARDVVTQGRNANCLASYGKAQCDAVAAANAWLDKMPETVKRTIDEASNADWQLVRVIQERDALRERVHQRAFEAEQTARDLNKLRAEVERLKQDNHNIQDNYGVAQRGLYTLRAELAAAKADSERLDWLEGDGDESFSVRHQYATDRWFDGAESFRAAIDAARQSTTPTP